MHPRFRTPHVTTILTGVAVGVFAAFTNIDEMVDLTNIGTLFAFILVCVGHHHPALPRAGQAALLQDARRPAGADARNALVRFPDDGPAVDHVASLRALARRRHGDLFPLRDEAERIEPGGRLKRQPRRANR